MCSSNGEIRTIGPGITIQPAPQSDYNGSGLTVFPVKVLGRENKLSVLYNVVVELIPISQGSKLRPREFGERAKVQTVDSEKCNVTKRAER